MIVAIDSTFDFSGCFYESAIYFQCYDFTVTFLSFGAIYW